MARRENAATTGPSPGLLGVVGRAGSAGAADRRVFGSIGGTRHAMTVCRGAQSARRTAQGRVGDRCPRHLVGHPAPHLLLLANTSVLADAVRPLLRGGARLWRSAESTAHQSASRPAAQPTDRPAPRPGTRDTEPAQPGHDVVATPSRGHSRGKGVLAV